MSQSCLVCSICWKALSIPGGEEDNEEGVRGRWGVREKIRPAEGDGAETHLSTLVFPLPLFFFLTFTFIDFYFPVKCHGGWHLKFSDPRLCSLTVDVY